MIEKIIRFVLTFIRTFKNVSLVIEYEERLGCLKAMKKTQCTNGTWDYDHYMHGYANGMILAIATLENKSPTFLNAPEEFIRVKEKGGGVTPKDFAFLPIEATRFMMKRGAKVTGSKHIYNEMVQAAIEEIEEEKNDNDLYDTSIGDSLEDETIIKFPDPHTKIGLSD